MIFRMFITSSHEKICDLSARRMTNAREPVAGFLRANDLLEQSISPISFLSAGLNHSGDFKRLTGEREGSV
jgi:hypothetical protein